MSSVEAYIGGLASFFSVWLFCLLQIIPAFVAYVAGAALVEPGGSLQKGITVMAPAAAGFVALFVATGLPNTSLGAGLFAYGGLLAQLGGVAMGLVGLYLVGLLSLNFPLRALGPVRIVAGFLFGAALALSYKPCVTPALTKVYLVARAPGYNLEGGLLLFYYSLGVMTAIGALAVAVALALGRASPAGQMVARRICGAILTLFAALVVSGGMTLYKSLLVGGLVPEGGA